MITLLVRCGRLKRVMRAEGLEINNCVSHIKLKMPVIPPNGDTKKIV